MGRRALITDFTSQDGAYLTEFQLTKGYEAHLVERRTPLFNTGRIDHFVPNPHVENRNFILLEPVGRNTPPPSAGRSRSAGASGGEGRGVYCWSSGMFLLRASCYVQGMGRFGPALLDACRVTLDGAVRDIDFIRLDATSFAACPSDTISYT